MTGVRGVGALLLCLAAGCAAAADWRQVADVGRLEFFVSYSGQQAPGVFGRFVTELRFDPAQPADGRLRVTVATLSADLDSADINEAIAGPEWFDFARFAEAQFDSETIAAGNDGGFIATGRMRLKGVERTIDVPFSWSQTGGRAVMHGELVLRRSWFGIGTGEWAATDIIGDKVRVRFDVTLEEVSR